MFYLSKTKPMSSQESKTQVWEDIKKIGVGMLTTEDGEDLRSRPMAVVQDDYSGSLWFFTSKDSAKAFEINDEHNVCVTFSDHKNDTFISLSGRAKLNQDKALIKQFWNKGVEAWFPNGADDPNVTLIEIQVYQGEEWDAKESQMVKLYEMGKALITDTTPDIGDHRKF
jgi:general stress protein 26